MDNVLTETFIVGLLAVTVSSASPLLLAGLGEAMSQRAGVINVGLEGYLLAGAFFGFLVSYFTGNVWLGALGGMVGGGIVALLAAYMAISRYADQIVTGLALVILTVGMVGTINRAVFSPDPEFEPERVRAESFSSWNIPGLSELPWIGDILFTNQPIVFIALLAVPATYLIFKSRIGLKLRAAGEHPEALETTGVSVIRVRYLVMVVTGLMAGLGGVFLSIGQTESFQEGLTGGRGFIAIAVAIVGRRHPVGVLAAALLFAMADAIQLWLPTAGIEVPRALLAMLPYIVTIIALAGILGRVRHPAAFLKPYIRPS